MKENKNNTSPEEWARGYQEFLTCEPVTPPKWVSDQILARVHADLNPKPWFVFSKLALIHAVVGTLSLLLCPQFGVGWTQGFGLMNFLMKFGHGFCMFACGALFVGGTAFLASFVLRPEEVRAIRKTEFLQFATLGLLSIGAFICAGASVVVELALFWVVGSVLGGLATLEMGWWVRLYFRRRLVYGL